MSYKDRKEITELIGKTLTSVEKTDDELIFVCDDGERYRMFHNQDCCESVTLDDVTGDLDDLIGSPILRAEETSSNTNPEGVTKEYQGSFTWTFYKLATVKSWVDLRWYGESNGCYSESVDFEEIVP
jgi:hypothetical protein